ncbi:hypothetical protein AAG565_14135, partial [Fontimonas sp. SYSU GA230001]|uniref:hypothetical protein n=1 Tax=Fontimonas sp. SYSU GA230001 TaxID=3142450 RepID=UPI0032B3DCAB
DFRRTADNLIVNARAGCSRSMGVKSPTRNHEEPENVPLHRCGDKLLVKRESAQDLLVLTQDRDSFVLLGGA